MVGVFGDGTHESMMMIESDELWKSFEGGKGGDEGGIDLDRTTDEQFRELRNSREEDQKGIQRGRGDAEYCGQQAWKVL